MEIIKARLMPSAILVIWNDTCVTPVEWNQSYEMFINGMKNDKLQIATFIFQKGKNFSHGWSH